MSKNWQAVFSYTGFLPIYFYRLQSLHHFNVFVAVIIFCDLITTFTISLWLLYGKLHMVHKSGENGGRHLSI